MRALSVCAQAATADSRRHTTSTGDFIEHSPWCSHPVASSASSSSCWVAYSYRRGEASRQTDRGSTRRARQASANHFAFGSSSEHQFQRELAGAWTADLIERAEAGQEVVQRRGDRAKAAIAQKISKICRRRREIRMIENIERLTAEIQGETVGKTKSPVHC